MNILRDLPVDLKKGRRYLPTEKLEPAGLFPEILLSSAKDKKEFLPLFRSYLDEAEAHLGGGLAIHEDAAVPANAGPARVRLADFDRLEDN